MCDLNFTEIKVVYVINEEQDLVDLLLYQSQIRLILDVFGVVELVNSFVVWVG